MIYHLFMIFAVFDPWLLTLWINCSCYHSFSVQLPKFCHLV